MPKYKQLTGTYRQIMRAMGVQDDLYLDDHFTAKKYREQLEKDRARSCYISFETSAAQIKQKIYDPNTFKAVQLFTQGDFYAGYSKLFFLTSEWFDKNNEFSKRYGRLPQSTLSFSYIDDQGIPCAFHMIKIEGAYINPNSKQPRYALTVARNTHATIDQRQVDFFCDEQLLTVTNYPTTKKTSPDLVTEQDINTNQLLDAIKGKIGSEKIFQLIKRNLTENQMTMSEETWNEFSQRIQPNQNLDNCDFKRAQLDRLMDISHQINSEFTNRIVEQSKSDVDFFEKNRYQAMLSGVITAASGHKNLVIAAQDLYLECLVAEFYEKIGGDELKTTIESGFKQDKLLDLWKKFTENMSPQNIGFLHYDTFIQKSHQLFKQQHYHSMLDKLDEAAHYSQYPTIQEEVIKLLAFFKKQTFTKLRSHEQKELMSFVSQLTSFTKKPSIEDFEKLIPFYTLFDLRAPYLTDIIPIDKLPQQAQYNLLVTELQEAIDQCKQAFVQEEALKRFKVSKDIQLSEFRPEDQAVLMNFITEMINFTKFPGDASYNKLMQFYPKLGLKIPSRDKFLQKPEFAYFNQMIAKKIPKPYRYRFDPQGRVVYDTIDHMNRPVTLSVDISDPAVQKKFETTVLEALKKNNTSDKTAQLILQAYKKIEHKNNIVPLQQQVHIHINTLAQQYQLALAENSFDDQERLDLVTQTMEEIYQETIDVFARGLLYAVKSTPASGPNAELDISKLNEVLHAQSEALKNKSKDILLKKIKEIVDEKRNNHSLFNATKHHSVPNPILSLNKKLELASWIQTQHLPTAGFSCQQIKTFAINASQELTEEIPRLRIQTSALMISENMSDKPFDERFHKRLEAIRSTYAFKKPSFTHYLFNGPYEQENNRPDNIALSLSAAHEYNRKSQSLCLVQAISLSNESRTLGYHILDWSGIGNEATLMAEMALCAQMDTLNTAAYQRFLAPPQSLLSRIYRALFKSTLFVNTHEGAKTKAQIQSLKTQWQQHQLKNIEEISTNNLLKHGLQKLMAYDLHFDSEHAILVQTLSLALQKTDAILNIDASSHSPALVLGYTQAFDALDKLIVLKKHLDLLAQANDKPSTIASAQSILQYLNQNCINQQYQEALLPMTSEEQESIIEATQAIQKAATPSIHTQLRRASQNDRHRSSSRHHAVQRHPANDQKPTSGTTLPTEEKTEDQIHSSRRRIK